MRIGITAFGTRGDTYPALALAAEVRQLGHQPVIVANKNIIAFVRERGFDAYEIDVDMMQVLDSELGHIWTDVSHNPFEQLNIMSKLLDHYGTQAAIDIWDVYQSVDAMICSFTTFPYVASFAEKLRKPVINVPHQPMHNTRHGQALYHPWFSQSKHILNLIPARRSSMGVWHAYQQSVNRIRREVLGLRNWGYNDYQRAKQQIPTLYSFSEQLIPRPTDWHENIHVIGYLFYDEYGLWEPDQHMMDFFLKDERPIYIGFGSMDEREPKAFTDMLVKAFEKTGHRGVIARGWSDLGTENVGSNILLINYAPHHYVFPQVDGAIHHGGAGTVGAGLRAGIPQTVVPHLSDQRLWGRRLYELGLGTKPIEKHQLSVDSLARALDALKTNTAIAENVTQMATKIRKENARRQAGYYIQRYLQQ